MKALIIEKRQCHQELLPTWVWVLSKIGFAVDVFVSLTTPRHRRISNEMRTLMGLKFTSVSTICENYDVIVNNSLYPDEYIPELKGTTLTFSVMHTTAQTYIDTTGLKSKQHTVLALGPHMQSSIGFIFQSIFSPPIYFGPIPSSIKKNQKERIVVQGTLEHYRRNYGCIVSLINRYGSQLPFVFEVLGDGNGKLTNHIASQIQSPLRDRLICTSNPNYSHYLTSIQQSGWIMPCVDETFSHNYFTNKITSSVMVAIGNGIPLILHQTLADIYGLQNEINCICYGSVTELVESVFPKAVSMSDEEYLNFVIGIRSFRENWLKVIEFNFKEELIR